MICEEFGGKDLTPETCASTKRNGWCDRTCEKQITDTPKNGNGGNVKSPQNTPIAIVQDSQISTTTPELVQSTQEKAKAITGHSVKAKADIMGVCGKTGDELTWSGCRQRKTKSNIETCKDCDQKAFTFYEKPMGRGWANSAARAIEVDCPDLGRKVKLPSCMMKQGRLVKAGKTCDITCQFWKGEKKVIRCIECGNKEVNNIGDLCPDCHFKRGQFQQEKIDEMRKYGQVKMWCPTCQTERMGIPGNKNHCGVCRIELQERQPAQEPSTERLCPQCCSNNIWVEADELCTGCQIANAKKKIAESLVYFCPNCTNQVKVKGMLCGDCQIEEFKKVENQKKPATPNHVKLVPIPNNLLTFLKMADQYTKDLASLQKNIEYNNARIVIELQKAVKEVEGAESL